ncbi:YfhO family protein [Methanosphaerula palustris]|uniref:Membrane protein 6-pyruvoyl-tetrahydropterin synthase-related domain-containing protein n=1 Tax=Methanosphaerula palustris (strain ATCC BAA-1556 / DSM 19958 / E1-9c) TaxID=521011 RepID=B8GDX3_METPE|nr:YfhO family protein [Methanosphaerula palustris]ACL17474.1 hypothetical protein Mpal_2176 [Methanosphaerula palustris E1-9c]
MFHPKKFPIVRIILQYKEFIFLLGLSLVFFYKIFLHSDQIIFPAKDVIAQYSFWRSFFATNILNGSGLPLWNPYVFSGTPFIGNPLSSMFYPISWFFVCFNPDTLFGYLFLLDIFLIGAFTYIYGRTINLDKYSALISAVIFMFCGAITPRIFAGHLANLDAIVWFPLALIFIEQTFKRSRIVYSFLAGIALGLMFLTGNIQFALYGAFTALLYLVIRTIVIDDLPTTRQKITHIVVVVFLSICICGLISAVQLLPTWEFSHLSSRGEGVSYDFSTEISLPVQNIFTLFVPDLYGPPTTTQNYWEFSFYIGILPLILIIIGLMSHRTKYTGIFSFFAIFSLLFSAGRFFPIYSLFFQFIPGFSMFQIPSTLLFVFSFSLSILAGLGCDFIINKSHGFHSRYYDLTKNILMNTALFSMMIGIFVMIIISTFYILYKKVGGILYVWNMLHITDIGTIYLIVDFLVFIFFFYVSVLVIYNKDAFKDPRLFKIILTTIIVADLFLFGARFIDTKDPNEVFKNPDFISIFKSEGDSYFRIYDETGIIDQNIALRNKLYLVNGYDPTYLKRYQQYYLRSQSGDINTTYSWKQENGIEDLDILRSLNVRYIITSQPLNLTGIEIIQNKSPFIYRLNYTYPRAFLVPVSEFNSTKPDRLIPAHIIDYSPNRITIHTNSSEDVYLVTSEIYYPGWSAEDEASKIEIEKYQGIFRSVRLSPGEHNISFSYFPKILTFA